MNCTLCQVLERVRKGELEPVYESEFAMVLVGDHQFYPGYCMVVSKVHVKEIFELSREQFNDQMAVIRLLSKVISNTYEPKKINLASLGNVVEHLHWHIFPRTKNDPNSKKDPWSHESRFSEFLTSEEQRNAVTKTLKESLSKQNFPF